MKFIQYLPALPMENFQNHYIFVFDFTSLQDAAEQLLYPELSAESLRLKMFSSFLGASNGSDSLERKKLSNVQIDKFGTAAENV